MSELLKSFITPEDYVLDVGCGIGNLTKEVECKEMLGIDGYDYSNQYHSVMMIHKLPTLELFEDNTFDIVLCLDIIEHLTKEEGFILIKEAERVARKKIFFLTPKEWSENKDAVENPIYWSYNNKLNYHKSLWTEKEFIDKGYKIKEDVAYIYALKEK